MGRQLKSYCLSKIVLANSSKYFQLIPFMTNKNLLTTRFFRLDPGHYAVDPLCRSCSLVVHSPYCLKFHKESSDLLNIFKIFAIHFCFQQLRWHISLELWFFYSMSAAVKPPPGLACTC